MIAIYRELFMLSVRQPAEAARVVFARNLPREALWTGLALVVVLSTLFYALTLVIAPPAPGQFVLSPMTMLVIFAAGLPMLVFGLFWAGQAMGGKGARFADVLAAVTWLQFMHLAVQLVTVVLMVASPYLAVLVSYATNLYGVWILAHFLNVAFRFGALSKAFFLLVVTILGLGFGLSIFLTVIGVAAVGVS